MRLYRITTKEKVVHLTSVSIVQALQFYCKFYNVKFEDLDIYTQVARVIRNEWKNIWYEELDEKNQIVKVTVEQVLKLNGPHIMKVEKNDGSIGFQLRRFD